MQGLEPAVDPRPRSRAARLARELHDDVTQRLARLAIDAGVWNAAPMGARRRQR